MKRRWLAGSQRMKRRNLLAPLLSAAIAAGSAVEVRGAGLESIETIVVIYAENRSFDNLYGFFPGASGLSQLTAAEYTQRDRDGSVLKGLPPVWGGLTEKGAVPVVTQPQTEHLPNAPFAIDDPKGFNLPFSVPTRDLWHRFYQSQMQIAGGKNDRFAAYADAGGLVMGHYANSTLPLWSVAKQFTLADNFFMGAFGGSFLNTSRWFAPVRRLTRMPIRARPKG
jgi:acid phosphatase